MRTFRMFFGLAIGFILFLFVARVLFFAFIAAAILSILYAVFRRLRDFINFDSNGAFYARESLGNSEIRKDIHNETEPLFYEHFSGSRASIRNIKFVEAI